MITPETRLDKPPFDSVRAAFYLVAGVIATYCLIVLMAMVHCWLIWHGDPSHLIEGTCDVKGRFFDLLGAALAAALAFAGGMMRKP